MGAFQDSSTPDPVMSTIELPVGGERVVLRWGVGQPILLIQGMSGTHDHWGQDLIDGLLAGGRSIICINHRGVYGSQRPEPGYSIADLADDQAAGLAILGIDEPIDVFGISMGGMTALELVLRHPGAVRTLALGCTTAGGSLMTQPDVADVQKLFAAQQSGDREIALRAGYEINLSQKFWSDEDAFAIFREQSMKSPVPVPVIMSQLQAIGGHDTGDRLGQITVPVGIMHGTEDRLLPLPNGQAIYERIPGSTLNVFQDAGHMYFWEEGERTASLLKALSHRGEIPSGSPAA